MSQWALGLDMARRSLETGGTFVKMAVDLDVTEFLALKAGLMIAGMVMSKGHVMIAASPPNFHVSDGNLFFFG